MNKKTNLIIETLLKTISRTEFLLLDHVTAQMEIDLELLKILETLKSELANFISVH